MYALYAFFFSGTRLRDNSRGGAGASTRKATNGTISAVDDTPLDTDSESDEASSCTEDEEDANSMNSRQTNTRPIITNKGRT